MELDTNEPFTFSDLLEVLNHLPPAFFDAYSYSMVRMMRDIVAAYLVEIKDESRGVATEAELARSKHLLQKLETLDYRFITGFPGKCSYGG